MASKHNKNLTEVPVILLDIEPFNYITFDGHPTKKRIDIVINPSECSIRVLSASFPPFIYLIYFTASAAWFAGGA